MKTKDFNIKGFNAIMLKNRIFCFRYVCLLLGILLLGSFPLHANKKILLLSSSSSTFSSIKEGAEGIHSVLSSDSVDIYIETIDKHFFLADDNVENFRKYISYKVKGSSPYDYIVANGDVALEFAIELKGTLFKDIPVIFFGVKNDSLALSQDNDKSITGVFERISLNETISEMRMLFPKSNAFYVLSDGTNLGQYEMKSAMMSAKNINSFDLLALSLKSMSFNDLAVQLELINKNVPVLLLSAQQDSLGNKLTLNESLKLIKKHLNAPLFHIWYDGLGKGVLGGKFVSNYDQGRLAGKIVQKLILGDSIHSMKVIEDNPESFFFDYNELKKYEINFSDLPFGTRVINEPRSFLSVKEHLYTVLAICFILLVIFYVFLLVYLKRLRKMHKTLLKEGEKTKESNQLKSRFLANMSHEIRTPLNAIVGFSELLPDTENKEEQKEYKDIIAENSEALLQVIEDILDISNIESGFIKLNEEEFDIVELQQSLYKYYTKISVKKDVKILIDCPYEECLITFDKRKLERIWSNYISNALKFTDKGFIKIGFYLVGDKIVIYVSDSGIGIPTKYQPRIFQRFIRFDSLSQGTGLGLSICKALIELLGGDVGFQSTEDKGSIFWASILKKPSKVVNKINHKDPEKIEYSRVKSKYLHILVAENYDDDFSLLCQVLRNHDVARAKDSERVLEMIAEHHYDLILIDVEMPELNTAEVIHKIRAKNNSMPIIFITSNPVDFDRDAATMAGCDEYYTKPFMEQDLTAITDKYYPNSIDNK